MEAEIEALPLHQRPPMRELGRRTEAAEAPFRPDRRRPFHQSRQAEVSGLSSPSSHPASLPLATTHRSGQRVVLASVCPQARALGLVPGMAATQARALLPALDLRPADPEGDAAFLRRLGLFAARRWTPRAALSGADGLWLDLGGVAHLFGGERAMCARILRFLARLGLEARIAVAGTLGAAYALARHGGEAVALCPPGGEADAIAGFPLSALRLDEAGSSAGRRLGLERVGDLLALPRAPLQRRFGSLLLTRLDQAIGHVPEPFEPIVPEDPPCATLRFAEPIGTAEAIGGAMEEALARLVEALEKNGLAVRSLLFLCDRVDGTEQAVAIGTARATRDPRHLLRLLRPRIEEIDPGFGIERVRLLARRCEPLGPTPLPSGLAGEEPAPDLVPLIDRLAGRLGARRLYRFSAVESDVPERSLRRIGPLAEPVPWPRWPRPVRLLSPPERVDNVVALLPDLPPRRFTWRGRAYRIVRADGPERIHGEWWKRAAEADAVRDYFQVEDEHGARFWLFRRGDGADPRSGDLSWWLQGLFG